MCQCEKNTMPVILTIRNVFTARKAWLIATAFALIFWMLLFLFTDHQLIQGNLGSAVAILNIVLQALLAILFGITAALIAHKIDLDHRVSKRGIGVTAVAAFLGSLVSGCASCSITLASYLGLGGIVAALPFFGFELKIAGIILFLVSIWHVARRIEGCAIIVHRQ